MTDKVSNVNDAVVLIINKAVSGIDTATAFLSQQIPDVIQQLLIWNAVKSALLCLLGVLFIVAYFKAARRFIKENDNDSDCVMASVGVGIIPTTSGLLLIICNFDWLQIMLAPKVWLIEYAAKLAGH